MASRESSLIDITPEVLLKAYACGIFPMAESADDPALVVIQERRTDGANYGPAGEFERAAYIDEWRRAISRAPISPLQLRNRRRRRRHAAQSGGRQLRDSRKWRNVYG